MNKKVQKEYNNIDWYLGIFRSPKSSKALL